MGECIYCGAPAESGEHWLPRGFGAIKGLDQLRDRLCEPCNNALGRELDEELLRTGPTGFLRSTLQIQGRHKGGSVNPFLYKVMGKESPTTMWMSCPHGDYKILGDPTADPRGVRPLRQLVFRKADGEIVPVPFPPAYDGARLASLLKERGVQGADLIEVYLGADETHESVEFQRVLVDALGKFDTMMYYGYKGDACAAEAVKVSAGISSQYLRALAKIGFHYYLAMSRLHTGAEFLFQPIRRFIRDGEGDGRSFVALTIPQFVGQLAEGKVPMCFSHFFGIAKRRGEIGVALQFFVGPDHMTPPSLVVLGSTSRPIESRSHWVSYYGEKIGGYDGEITEVPVLGFR